MRTYVAQFTGRTAAVYLPGLRRELADLAWCAEQAKRELRQSPCRVCATVTSRVACSRRCYEIWEALRYHVSDRVRAAQLRATARWRLDHGSARERRYSRRVLDGEVDDRGRWLIVGSTAWWGAHLARRHQAPVWGMLPADVRTQIAAAGALDEVLMCSGCRSAMHLSGDVYRCTGCGDGLSADDVERQVADGVDDLRAVDWVVVGPDHIGSASRYGRGCRCDGCRAAATMSVADLIEGRRQRGVRCPNCGGDPGPYADGGCYACYQWRLIHGTARPPEVYDPPPRTCDVCGREMQAGEGLSHGRCPTCARYWARNGRERPQRLWR